MKKNSQSQQLLRWAFLLSAYFFMMPSHAWAVACDVLFSNGIQTTSANGNISLKFHSALTGGVATLKTKTLTDNTSWIACSGSSCVASGSAATSSTVTFVTGTGANGAISVAANGTLSKAAGNYSTVTVGQAATLTFSTSAGTYKTTAFTTNYQSIVQLPAGDYWINGNLTLAQATVLSRVASSGTTRIFVNGNVSIGFQVSTQNFTSDQLLIYATGTITSTTEANITGFIYAVGDVSFDYLSTINGAVSGANFIGLGNQITVNYQPSALSTANFAPLCSGVSSAAVLLGSWHMDEGSWNGTANEVIDSSGNAHHGRARIANGTTALPSTNAGSPAYTIGAQSTCRYGEFDGTGSAPTRQYTYVELSGFPTLPNGFTFAAWIRSSNASAQHQRILVRDDAQDGWGLSLADGTGQPELRFFARNITNSGAVTGQGVNPNCGVFCIDTNPILTSNTWYYVASVVDNTAKTVTLYVYNASGVLQAKTSGGYAGTWTDGTGLAAIGGETSASSEGTQTSWHFLGNIDEVNIYSGALSQTSIESLLPSVRTCPGPDHYELQIPASGVACAGTDVTVRACSDSAVPCTQDAAVNSNVTVSTSAGSLAATTFALVGGSATTKLLYGAAADNATATVTLSGEVTTAVNSRKCCTASSSCNVANACITTFNTAGFIFSNTATGTSGNIPSEIAGTTDSSAYVRALKTNTTTGACTARFTTPQVVPLAYQCVNPTTCIAGQTLTVNGTSVQSNSNTASPITYSNASLTFDAQGSAPLNLNYSDVGQIHLLAKLALSATASDPAYTLTGTSNDFVVRPYTLAVTAVQTSAAVANTGGTSVAGTAAQFVAAGTPFTVKVEARNSLGARTPNFGNESPSENNIQLNNLTVMYPTGGNPTAISQGSGFTATAPAGTFVNTTLYWDQVGSFTAQARLSDNTYINAGDIALPTTTATIGRFYPDHYTLINPLTSNSCSSFSYMSQPAINLSYTLNAQSLLGTVLTNYGGNYATVATIAAPNYVAENADAANGASLSSRVSAGVIGVWTSGVMSINSLTASFNRAAGNQVPDGPFASLQLGVNISDAFDSRSLQNLDMNATTTGACGAGCTAKTLGSPLNLLYGRLRLDDAFGPETVNLPVNFITEYWKGSYFTLNANDSLCTVIPRSAVTYPAGTIVTDANRTVSLGGGTTQGTYTFLDAAGIHFSAGTAGQYFTAPGAGKTGTFIIGIDLTTLTWLRYDWNQDGNYADTKLPNANIGFGSYRGNDRIIYWREKLQ